MDKEKMRQPQSKKPLPQPSLEKLAAAINKHLVPALVAKQLAKMEDEMNHNVERPTSDVGYFDNYPLYLTGKDIMDILQVSKAKAYQTLDECPHTISLGKTRRVHRDKFFDWLMKKEGDMRAWAKKK